MMLKYIVLRIFTLNLGVSSPMVVTTVDAKKNDCPKDQDGGGVSSSPPSLDGVGMDTPRLLADTTFSINSSRLSSEAYHMCCQAVVNYQKTYL